MSKNMIIGLGNTGTQIVKQAARSKSLQTDVDFFAIDSVTAAIDMKDITNVTTIPIISDDKSGSGRDRERGAAMFEFHNKDGKFSQMYATAEKAKSPIVVVTSSAGGTGSGAVVPLCRNLRDKGLDVIPFIIVPAKKDPVAFQLNTSDLFLELEELEIRTYCIFQNEYAKANYTEINRDIVNAIEIIFGKRYDSSSLDTIDDSDLDMILRKPGRFIAVEASAPTKEQLQRTITEKVMHGYQPVWNAEQMGTKMVMMAFALTSPFASDDFEFAFELIRERLPHSYDEYRNICNRDGDYKAVVIIAGLPQIDLPQTDFDWDESGQIATTKSKSSRPSFLQKKSKIGKSTLSSTPTTTLKGITLVDDK